MKPHYLFLALVPILLAALPLRAESKVLLEEGFTGALSKDWFWGLVTWTAKDGVLRGFESGARRHGPVKMHKLSMADAVIDLDYRLTGKATFAGIIFNGNQERGHLVHLVAARDSVRLIVHPKKGEPSADLLKDAVTLAAEEWHHVHLEFKGDTVSSTIGNHEIHAKHACIAEKKETFGLSGDSGGPDGEKAGALEFRKLRITTP